MIYYLNPKKNYTTRQYLMQWVQNDTLVITDIDFNQQADRESINQLLSDHPIKNCIVDITHNVTSESGVPFDMFPVLTNNFLYWYHPSPNHVFFPLWLWMYSTRNGLWWEYFSFDAGDNKTHGIMCLNHIEREHRTWLWNEFNRRHLVDKMMYTFANERALPGESLGPHRADASVNHPVYNQYAVNIVTETATDMPYISEKTCKPFVARQIPIIVGSVGVNKFLQDIGLDMFADVVPWRQWDSETNLTTKLAKIVDFVEQWINSGTILHDYQRVLSRVEYNKQYFHSETFRNRIMSQMSNFKPA